MVFSSCKGLNVPGCKKIINRAHKMAPAKFGGTGRVKYVNEKIREPVTKEDPAFHPDNLLLINDYWLCGVRTDFEDMYVAGVDGAGKVECKYPWCTLDDTTEGYTCHELGPFDCSGGMTVDQCCTHLKGEVTSGGISLTDLHGNHLDCYDSPPPIAKDDPLDYGRVKLHTDKGNTVVKSPQNG